MIHVSKLEELINNTLARCAKMKHNTYAKLKYKIWYICRYLTLYSYVCLSFYLDMFFIIIHLRLRLRGLLYNVQLKSPKLSKWPARRGGKEARRREWPRATPLINSSGAAHSITDCLLWQLFATSPCWPRDPGPPGPPGAGRRASVRALLEYPFPKSTCYFESLFTDCLAAVLDILFIFITAIEF